MILDLSRAERDRGTDQMSKDAAVRVILLFSAVLWMIILDILLLA